MPFVAGISIPWGLQEEYAERYGLDLFGYCLMTTHIHLVGSPQAEDSVARTLERDLTPRPRAVRGVGVMAVSRKCEHSVNIRACPYS